MSALHLSSYMGIGLFALLFGSPAFAQDKTIEDKYITVKQNGKGKEVTVQMKFRLDEGKAGDKVHFEAAKKKFGAAIDKINASSPQIQDPLTGKKQKMKFEIVWSDERNGVRPIRIHGSSDSLPEHWPEGFSEKLKDELREQGNVPRKNTQQDLFIEEKSVTFGHELGHSFGLDDEKGGFMDHGAPKWPPLKRHYLTMSWPFFAKDQADYEKRKTMLARIQVNAGKAGDLQQGTQGLLDRLTGDERKMAEDFLKFLEKNNYGAKKKAVISKVSQSPGNSNEPTAQNDGALDAWSGYWSTNRGGLFIMRQGGELQVVLEKGGLLESRGGKVEVRSATNTQIQGHWSISGPALEGTFTWTMKPGGVEFNGTFNEKPGEPEARRWWGKKINSPDSPT